MAGDCEVFHNRSVALSALILSDCVYMGFDGQAAQDGHGKQCLLLCEYSNEQSLYVIPDASQRATHRMQHVSNA